MHESVIRPIMFPVAFLFILTIRISAQQAITKEQASQLSRPPLECIDRKYPCKPEIVMNNDMEALPTSFYHPAFYGCFDWHSSVHGHWSLVKLLKLFPELPEKHTIMDKLLLNITPENIRKEVEFFNIPNNGNFERTYGWAWLLKLQEELLTWTDPFAKQLAVNLQPLADTITSKYIKFLPRLNYPIRAGEHTNTAFGLSFAWDYADQTGNQKMKVLIEQRARTFYKNDKNCPIDWEPGGFDFLSPCLAEADLMARILEKEEFQSWFYEFLPDLLSESVKIEPAVVTDRSDPKLVHLDGLNFNRAWCLYRISGKLDRPDKDHLRSLANRQLNASLPFLFSGDYSGEHWLISFALFALTLSSLEN